MAARMASRMVTEAAVMCAATIRTGARRAEGGDGEGPAEAEAGGTAAPAEAEAGGTAAAAEAEAGEETAGTQEQPAAAAAITAPVATLAAQPRQRDTRDTGALISGILATIDCTGPHPVFLTARPGASG